MTDPDVGKTPRYALTTREVEKIGLCLIDQPIEESGMVSEARRDPLEDHLLTPDNAALIVIDYQPIQVFSIRSMDQKELVFNIVNTAKAALNYNLPIVHSTVNVQTGANVRLRDLVED